ncbi:FlgD immunoglobulin-like domain containing protein, partial [Candidatus Eisenbacteria bacterium]
HWEGTAVSYHLLGDPSMKMRCKNPGGRGAWTIERPDSLDICQGEDCVLPIRVTDGGGSPVFDVLAAIWKPGEQSGEDEVLDNRYTDEDGWAHVPCEPETPGWLYFTVQDDFGEFMMDSIGVGVNPSDVKPTPTEPPLRLTVRPTAGPSAFLLDFGRALDEPAEVRIYDLAGRTVKSFEVTAGTSGVEWNGRNDSGREVGAGIYFVRLIIGNSTLTTRLPLVR